MKVQFSPSCILAPLPAIMVSCAGIDTPPNIITIAWTGIINTNPPRTYISVRPQRYSHGLIKESGEFVINLVSKDLCFAADFCGARTGNSAFSTSARGKMDIKQGKYFDKWVACNLTVAKSLIVSAPSIGQSPVSIECRVFDIIPLGSHDMFLADIVAVSIDNSLLNESGKLCMEKADLLCYAHGDYIGTTVPLEHMGYSVKKSKSREKK